jgi:prenyltransferase beta subunit
MPIAERCPSVQPLHTLIESIIRALALQCDPSVLVGDVLFLRTPQLERLLGGYCGSSLWANIKHERNHRKRGMAIGQSKAALYTVAVLDALGVFVEVDELFYDKLEVPLVVQKRHENTVTDDDHTRLSELGVEFDARAQQWIAATLCVWDEFLVALATLYRAGFVRLSVTVEQLASRALRISLVRFVEALVVHQSRAAQAAARSRSIALPSPDGLVGEIRRDRRVQDPGDVLNCETVYSSYVSARHFLVGQASRTRPAWGPEPEAALDPWTTGQVVSMLAGSDTEEVKLRALEWLMAHQLPDGSWGSVAYGLEQGDTPATASATVALLDSVRSQSLTTERAISWLTTTYHQGWTTIPNDNNNMSTNIHLYSTAYALRALSRTKKSPKISFLVQEASAVIRRSQATNAGWGYQIDAPSDPTFTCYALHGLCDASRIWGAQVMTASVGEALQWLLSQQAPEGHWSDWHGVPSSPEATGYSIYTLLAAGLAPADSAIQRALRWLLAAQDLSGWWPLVPEYASRPNSWVTFSVLLGLRAYLAVLGDRRDNAPTTRPLTAWSLPAQGSLPNVDSVPSWVD